MKKFCKLTLLAGLTLGMFEGSAFGDTIVYSDTFQIGTSTNTGFALNEGVNQGINPPTVTRLTGTAKDANPLRYINRNAGKADTSFLIQGSKFRVTSGSQNGRASISEDGTTPFDFGPSLGVSAATPANPIVYEIKVAMLNNAAGIQRMSLGFATVETDANNWDFGLQLYKAVAADANYTVSKRINTNSIGVASRNDPMFTSTVASAAEASFVIRITDAGAETSAYNSRVQVSQNNGTTWAYDTKADPNLPNGFRFDGSGRFFSFDVAGNNSSFVTYDTFSVTLISPTWNGAGANNNWSNGTNWTRGTKPATGENVVFSGSTRQANVNDISSLSVASLQFASGGFSLSGNDLTVTSTITNVTGNSSVANNIILGGNTSVRSTAGTLSIGGNISGSGFSLTKTGAGALVLSGANTYTGNTAVNVGTLSVNSPGSLDAGSAVTVSAGAILSGNGTISGTVTLNGTISPGASPGTLTTGAQTWNSGGTNLWEINNTTNDVIVADSLTIAATTASKFTINVTALEALSGWDNTVGHTWTLVETTSGVSGFSADKFTIVDNFSGLNAFTTGNFHLAVSGNNLVLVFSPVKANADSVTRNSGAAVKISVASLLSNDVVVSGTAAIQSVSATSTNGGTVVLTGTNIFYTPTTNNPATDRFTYTMTDGNGNTDTAVVTVTVGAGDDVQSKNILNTSNGTDGDYTVNFAGVPGLTYSIQYSAVVEGPWATIGTATVSTNGYGTYHDAVVHGGGNAFYRTVYP